MGKLTAIEWTQNPDGTPGATWNPWIGCNKVSPACQNCYAERDMKRYGRDFNKVTRTADNTFNSPLKWKPTRIFVCSWSDFYHKDVPVLWRMDALSIIERCPQHTFILLTKRPGNIKKMDYASWNTKGWPDNVWLGVTVENQEAADARIPELIDIPAKMKFLSCEPLLGPLDITKYIGYNTHECKCGFHETEHDLLIAGKSYYCNKCETKCLTRRGISWVIAGGESGPHARSINPDWVRGVQKQCEEAKTPFMFKQWGEFNDQGVKVGRKVSGCTLDGKTYKEFPKETK